jgi:proline iminopeptidase
MLALHAGCSARARPVAPSGPGGGDDGYIDAGSRVRLYYRTMGAIGEPIVVIHGGPGFTMDYIAEDIRGLSDSHRLIFYDQRGTGRSTLVTDAAALDAQRFADDLEALRRHFRLDRITLLGHSWGAGVAALYAIRYPDRVHRLILVGAIPLRLSELTRTFDELSAKRGDVGRQLLQERRKTWMADPGNATACRAYYTVWFEPFFTDPAMLKTTKGDFCAGSPAALRNKVASVDTHTAASLGNWDWRSALRTVSAPTVIIHGTHDVIPVSTAREWADAVPNARVVLLDGIGHFPYLEAPERFKSAVNEFMAAGSGDRK